MRAPALHAPLAARVAALLALCAALCAPSCRGTDAHDEGGTLPVVELRAELPMGAPFAEGSVERLYKGRTVRLGPPQRFAVRSARESADDLGWPAVYLELADGDALHEWTGARVGRRVGVIFRGEVMTLPTLEEPLHDALLVSLPHDSARWTLDELLAEWSR